MFITEDNNLANWLQGLGGDNKGGTEWCTSPAVHQEAGLGWAD